LGKIRLRRESESGFWNLIVKFEKFSASKALLKPGFIWNQVFFSPDLPRGKAGESGIIYSEVILESLSQPS
jgi:hypothetical protein